MMTNKRIYISGPITGVEDYMKHFDTAEEALWQMGAIPINPAKVNAQLPGRYMKHEDYMITSLAMLSMCDMVMFLENWEHSKGCKIEMNYALTHDIPVKFFSKELRVLTVKDDPETLEALQNAKVAPVQPISII